MPSTLSIITNVFPPVERAKAIGIWAGVRRPRHRDRPRHRRLARRARRLELDLPRQPAVRRRRAARSAGCSSPSPATPPRRRWTCRGFALSTAGLVALVWAIIEAPGRGWTDPGDARGLRRRRPGARRVRPLAAALAAADARRAAVPQPALLGVQPRHLAGLLRPVRDDLLPHAVPAADPRLQRVRGRAAHAPRRGRAGPRPARSRPSSPSGSGTKVVVAAGLLLVGAGLGAAGLRRRGQRLRPRRRLAGRARHRHGHRDGARHRRDHGLAAAGEGQRRLRGQRRDAHHGRRARRGDPRVRAVQRVPWRHGGRRRRDARARRRGGPGLAGRRHRGRRAGRRRDRASELLDAAQDAFLSGMHTAAIVAARRRARRLRRRARAAARAGGRGRPTRPRRTPSGSSSPHERRPPRAPRAGRAPRRPTWRSCARRSSCSSSDGYRGADDGEGARALGRRQGDALPPLRLQGGARARGRRAPAPATCRCPTTRAACRATSRRSPARRSPSAQITGASRRSCRGCSPRSRTIPELQAIFYDALVQPRRDTLEAILRRAIERGEIRADVDVELAIDVLAGPMIYKHHHHRRRPRAARRRCRRALLELVIDGLRPR